MSVIIRFPDLEEWVRVTDASTQKQTSAKNNAFYGQTELIKSQNDDAYQFLLSFALLLLQRPAIAIV